MTLVLGSGPATPVANSSWIHTNQQHLVRCLYRGHSPPRGFLHSQASHERWAGSAIVNRSVPLSPMCTVLRCTAILPLISWKRVSSRSNQLCLTPSGGQFSNSPWSWLSLLPHITPFPSLRFPWICTPEKGKWHISLGFGLCFLKDLHYNYERFSVCKP